MAVKIVEVFANGTPGAEWVKLKNVGGSNVTFSAEWLCQWPTYWQFPTSPTSFTLNAGACVIVHWNQSGTNTAANIYTGTLSADLVPNGGEVGFYTCSTFSSSSCIHSYIEWGSGGHTREPAGVGAGVWSNGDFCPAMTGGQSLQLTGGFPGDLSCQWFLAAPNPSGC